MLLETVDSIRFTVLRMLNTVSGPLALTSPSCAQIVPPRKANGNSITREEPQTDVQALRPESFRRPNLFAHTSKDRLSRQLALGPIRALLKMDFSIVSRAARL